MLLFGGTNGSALSDTWLFSALTVTAVSPISGPVAGGTPVTITGTGFSGATAVKFGATSVTPTVVSPTEITATSPAESAGTVDITVTDAAGTSPTSAADQFTYQAAPTVSAISPTSGVVAGGTSVAITGTNFAGATAVDFGTEAAFPSYTVVNPTTITAFSPAELAGVSVDVTVTTPTGTSATSAADTFTYNPVPSSPASARAPAASPVARPDARHHHRDRVHGRGGAHVRSGPGHQLHRQRVHLHLCRLRRLRRRAWSASA